MEQRQESLASLRELLRRAGGDRANEAGDDYRRNLQRGLSPPDQDRAAAMLREDGHAGASGEDWSGTLDLVLRSGERLVARDERVRDLEAELRELTDTTALRMQQLRAQIADLQSQLDEAQAGRRHAEEWLRSLNDVVRERFSFEAAQDEAPAAAQAS